MIAAIAAEDENRQPIAPPGWVLIRRIENSDNVLVTYRKVAGGSEPSSYTWAVSGQSDMVGGMMAFSGVDTTVPIDVEDGQPTNSNTLNHSAPSVTTTVPGAMLVTWHAFSSSTHWTPPPGMTEAVDVMARSSVQSGGVSISGNYEPRGSAGATGSRTTTASQDSDRGNSQAIALRPTGSG